MLRALSEASIVLFLTTIKNFSLLCVQLQHAWKLIPYIPVWASVSREEQKGSGEKEQIHRYLSDIFLHIPFCIVMKGKKRKERKNPQQSSIRKVLLQCSSLMAPTLSSLLIIREQDKHSKILNWIQTKHISKHLDIYYNKWHWVEKTKLKENFKNHKSQNETDLYR